MPQATSGAPTVLAYIEKMGSENEAGRTSYAYFGRVYSGCVSLAWSYGASCVASALPGLQRQGGLKLESVNNVP